MIKRISSNSGFFKWLAKQTEERATRTTNGIAAFLTNPAGIMLEIRNRSELNTLRNAAPGRLEDLGFTQADLEDALQLPLDQSAGKWLRKKAWQRKSKSAS